MSINERAQGTVIDHALARHTLTRLRDVETEQIAFRKGLVKLGRLCGYEIVDGFMRTEDVDVRTPLADATGAVVTDLESVVIVNVLRAATPFVEGLLKAFPSARQGVISAGRDEAAGMDESGTFPIDVDYVKVPRIEPADTVIVADPMLATGSTATTVLKEITADAPPEAEIILLSAVSAPEGIERVEAAFPKVTVLTVAIDDHLDADGYIVPGLGDAGDRAFGTNDP
ncbi:MAG: uracil phosphoribosyltransferase [Halodesulfurarchaeum sp.]